MNALCIRRWIALAICPELCASQGVVRTPAGELSRESEHVIRLGRLFTAATGSPDFLTAVGLERRKPGRGRQPEPPEGYIAVLMLQNDWRAFVKRPPQQVGPKVYNRYLQFFSTYWPLGALWPPDIPRPPRSSKPPEVR